MLSLLATLAATLAVAAAAPTAPAPLRLFVQANNGVALPATGDGSMEAPFTSLHAAFDAVCALRDRATNKLPNHVEVTLSAGEHALLGRTLNLTACHGGDDAGHTVTVVGSSEGSSVSGGFRVPGPWHKASEEKLAQLKAINGTLWIAPLPSAANHEEKTLQMWHGDTRLQLSASEVKQYVTASADYLQFKPGDVDADYTDRERVQVVTYESWTASIHLIKNISSTQERLYFTNPYNAQWAGSAAGRRFYIQNVEEELTEQGEFFVDPVAKLVYLVAGDSAPSGTYTLAGQRELLLVSGNATHPVKNMHWKDVTYEFSTPELSTCLNTTCDAQSAAFLTTAAVHLRYAQDNSFTKCTFKHTGGYALWFEDGTLRNTVSYAHVNDVGAGAIRIGQADGTNIPGYITISDSVLEDGGHFYQEGCGVLAQNVHNTQITHNEIGYFRYTGVSTGWTWGYGATNVTNVSTTFNHIHHIGQGYLSDMGCVYTLGHQPGSVIENNICTDVQSYNYGGWAYYTDEGSRDEVFANNIATRIKCAGHHQHYGTDNLLTNNIYYDVNIGDVATPGRPDILMKTCDEAIRASTHSRPSSCHPDTKPTADCCCHPGCDQGKCSSFKFEKNIVLQPSDYATGPIVGTTFALGLDNFTFDSNVYFAVGNPTGAGSTFDVVNGKGESFAKWQQAGRDKSSEFTDPKFENITTYKLSEDSPALKLGFKPIDITKVGPRATHVGCTGKQRATSSTVELLDAPLLVDMGVIKAADM